MLPAVTLAPSDLQLGTYTGNQVKLIGAVNYM